jgi:integrase
LKWHHGDPSQFEVKDIDHTGYYLRLCRGGAKTWLYRYKLNGKLRRINMGRYPFIDCLAVFTRYSEVRTQVIGGVDVFAQRADAREAEQVQKQAESLTLSALFHDHYYPRFASAKKSKRNNWHYFTVKIEPTLGSKSATEIIPEDVERLIRPLEVRGFNTARLTLALLRKMFNWALEPASAEAPGDGALIANNCQNPCRFYRLNPVNKPRPINRYLKADEIRQLWNALGEDNASRIIKLQLLTGCRVGEVCGMNESELDRDANEWLIPHERVKTGRPHLVPLTDMMLELIGLPGKGRVFKSKSKCGHTTYFVVNQRLKRLCERLSIAEVSTHTMRRTFITHLARLGVSIEIRNRLTNHADSSVDGIYNQHDYSIEKKETLAMWDREIQSIVATS